MKVDYSFHINHLLILEILDFVHEGDYPEAFVAELEMLEEDAKYRPFKDFHWEITRMIIMHFSAERMRLDPNFKKLNEFLMSKWNEEVTDDVRKDVLEKEILLRTKVV